MKQCSEKKYIVITVCILSLITLLYGCKSENKNNSSTEYDNNAVLGADDVLDIETVDSSLFTPYTIRTAQSFVMYLDDIKNNNNISVIRNSNGKYYTVSKLSDGSYFFMLFEISESDDGSTEILTDGFKAFKLAGKDDFKDVKVGTPKSEVLKLDPSAYEGDGYTLHRFSDKSVLKIQYTVNETGETVVNSIEDVDNEHSVLTYLLPQDLSLITK